MDDPKAIPHLSITSNSEANVKIATMCGLLGASVSAASYLLIKGIVKKTIEGANDLLRETCEIKPQHRNED